MQVNAHLGLLTALLNSPQPDRLRFRIAYAAAEAGDEALGSYVEGYRRIVATQTGDPATALLHLRMAIDTAPRSLSEVTRSWLTMRRPFGWRAQP
jgi:hypothetical protein